MERISSHCDLKKITHHYKGGQLDKQDEFS